MRRQMAELKKKEVEVAFVKSNEFRTIAATGAWGGPNPQGEIVCSFYVERQQFPDELVVETDPMTKKPIEKTKKQKLVREMQVSVIMRPDIAKSIGEWLVNNAKQVSPEIVKLLS